MQTQVALVEPQAEGDSGEAYNDEITSSMIQILGERTHPQLMLTTGFILPGERENIGMNFIRKGSCVLVGTI